MHKEVEKGEGKLFNRNKCQLKSTLRGICEKSLKLKTQFETRRDAKGITHNESQEDRKFEKVGKRKDRKMV
jgi:hypothetical protein